jgi:hypothetical protein
MRRRSVFGERAKAAAKRRTGGAEKPLKRIGRLPNLSLTTLDLRTTLTDLVTWIALANHVDPTATTHNLAIGVSVLKCTDR